MIQNLCESARMYTIVVANSNTLTIYLEINIFIYPRIKAIEYDYKHNICANLTILKQFS